MKKVINIIFVVVFLFMNLISFDYVQATTLQPTLIQPSYEFNPIQLRGLKIQKSNPFELDFIVDSGDFDGSVELLENQSQVLIRYFLAGLTVPNDELWVNLNPNEPDRVMERSFSTTEMGANLLGQDYLLKKLTSSLMSPESESGKKFWNQVYEHFYLDQNEIDIPLKSFERVWIVPEFSRVYQDGDVAMILDAKLKVLTETEYFDQESSNSQVMTDALKQSIVPVLEKEINEGESFAPLRQVFYSLILSQWYKQTLHKSIMASKYLNQSKVRGIDLVEEKTAEEIFDNYLDLFRKGVFEKIQEEYDPVKQEVVTRKYIAGGMTFMDMASLEVTEDEASLDEGKDVSNVYHAKVDLAGLETSEKYQVPQEKEAIQWIDKHYKQWYEAIYSDNIEDIRFDERPEDMFIKLAEYLKFLEGERKLSKSRIRKNDFLLFVKQGREYADILLHVMSKMYGYGTYSEFRKYLGQRGRVEHNNPSKKRMISLNDIYFYSEKIKGLNKINEQDISLVWFLRDDLLNDILQYQIDKKIGQKVRYLFRESGKTRVEFASFLSWKESKLKNLFGGLPAYQKGLWKEVANKLSLGEGDFLGDIKKLINKHEEVNKNISDAQEKMREELRSYMFKHNVSNRVYAESIGTIAGVVHGYRTGKNPVSLDMFAGIARLSGKKIQDIVSSGKVFVVNFSGAKKINGIKKITTSDLINKYYNETLEAAKQRNEDINQDYDVFIRRIHLTKNDDFISQYGNLRPSFSPTGLSDNKVMHSVHYINLGRINYDKNNYFYEMNVKRNKNNFWKVFYYLKVFRKSDQKLKYLSVMEVDENGNLESVVSLKDYHRDLIKKKIAYLYKKNKLEKEKRNKNLYQSFDQIYASVEITPRAQLLMLTTSTFLRSGFFFGPSVVNQSVNLKFNSINIAAKKIEYVIGLEEVENEKGEWVWEDVYYMRLIDRKTGEIEFDNQVIFDEDGGVIEVVKSKGEHKNERQKLEEELQKIEEEQLTEEDRLIEEYGLEEMIGSLIENPKMLMNLILLTTPLTPEMVSRIITHSFQGLRNSRGQFISEKEGYKTTDHQVIFEQNQMKTNQMVVTLQGRVEGGYQNVQIGGDRHRVVKTDRNGNFSVRLILQRGKQIDLTFFGFDDETQTKSRSQTISVQQTLPTKDLMEIYMDLLQMKEGVLKKISKTKEQYDFLMLDLEISLLKKFTSSEKEGFAYLKRLIRATKNLVQKKIYKDILEKFEMISDITLPDDWREDKDLFFYLKYVLYYLVQAQKNPELAGYIVALEQGLGKTIIMLTYIRMYMTGALVVVPNALMSTWSEQEKKFFKEAKMFFANQSSAKAKVAALQLTDKLIRVVTKSFLRNQSHNRFDVLNKGFFDFRREDFESNPDGLENLASFFRAKLNLTKLNDRQVLNKVLKVKNLYKILNVRPKEVKNLIAQLENGQNLSLRELMMVNRYVLEAKFPDLVPSLTDENFREQLLVLDESDFLTRDSLQTQGVKELLNSFIVLMSATPFGTSLNSVQAVLEFLERQQPGFKDIKTFRQLFKKGDPESLRLLHFLLAPYMIRITAEDVFDVQNKTGPLLKKRLPRRNEIDPEEYGAFTLLAEQENSIYELFTNFRLWAAKQMKQALTEKDTELKRKNKSTSFFSTMHSLLQIYNDPEYIGVNKDSPKHLEVDRIVNHEIKNLNGKVVIFAEYVEEVNAYVGRYQKYGAVSFSGQTKGEYQNNEGFLTDEKGKVKRFKFKSGLGVFEDPKGEKLTQRDYNRLKFQNDPQTKVIVVTYGSGAKGITLTAATALVRADLAREYSLQFQADKRTLRVEDDEFLLKREVRYYTLVAKHSVRFLNRMKKLWELYDRKTGEVTIGDEKAKGGWDGLDPEEYDVTNVYQRYFRHGTFVQYRRLLLSAQKEFFRFIMDRVMSYEGLQKLVQKWQSGEGSFLGKRNSESKSDSAMILEPQDQSYGGIDLSGDLGMLVEGEEMFFEMNGNFLRLKNMDVQGFQPIITQFNPLQSMDLRGVVHLMRGL